MSTRPIRTFTDLLPVLNRGRFVEKCNEHLTHWFEANPGHDELLAPRRAS